MGFVRLISLLLLARSIGSLVKPVRGSAVLRDPVVPVQGLRDSPGRLGFPSAGLLRTSVKSFSRSRLTLRSFDAPSRGPTTSPSGASDQTRIPTIAP